MQGTSISQMRYIQRQRLKNKRLEIFGFGDLVRRENSKWKVPVFMLDKNEQVEKVEFLFSTIGDLRLGQVFEDGFPIMPEPKKERSFVLPPSIDWEVQKVTDALKYCPFFQKQNELIKQNLFVFKSGKKTIYIPQLELAKILFFKKAILTRYAFQATGLSLFAYDEVTANNETKITFLPDVPMNILEDAPLLKHLSWIYNQPDILNSFASCFYKMRKQNDDVNSKLKKFSFEFDPPNLENVILKARCSEPLWRHLYVDEILGLEALPMPQKNTVFIHPHANRYKKSGGSNGETVTKPGAYNTYSDYGINIDSDDVGETQNVSHVDTLRVQLSYSHPTIYRVDRTVMPIGDKNNKGAFPVPVTTSTVGGFDESVAGGKQKQLEFDSIHNPEIINFNLDNFVEEVGNICELNNWGKVHKAIFLPEVGRHRFHLIGVYTRQAILIIIKTNNHYCYLVEVQTNDDKNLSTLVFKKQTPFTKEERILFFNELIVRLIKASGHWRTKDIEHILEKYLFLEFLRFKHPPRTIENDKVEIRNQSWKERLAKWIIK